jgi:hypothetical protein
MARALDSKLGKKQTVIKRTSQGGVKPKTSAMNKSQKRSYKRYRGQGK